MTRDEAVKLADFARWVIQETVFDGGADLDAWSIQMKAAELGLIKETAYNPEKHGSSDYAEPGDEWFVFSPILQPVAASPLSQGGQE